MEGLANYCVIKKFSNGWMVSQKDNPQHIVFISRAELVRMGYLEDYGYSPPVPRNPTSVIVVPTGKKRDLEGNWRKH